MTDNQFRQVAADADMINKPLKVLCVDDEEFNLEILQKHVKKAGYEPVGVKTGEEAWSVLQQSLGEIDMVLLDRMMPGMDGLDVLKKMKSDPALKDIPVIMQTAKVASEEAVEGIEAGAYYYVTKPYSAEMLLSIVDAAARDAKQQRTLVHQMEKRDEMLELVMYARFEVKTLQQVRTLATFLGNFSDEPSRVVMGLTALLTNAVEHGNLGIGYERKQELLLANEWETEVERLLAQPENSNKRVKVTFERRINDLQVTIRDEGKGFEWKTYVDFDPSRMTDPNGRGIAMANIMNPGCIEYIGEGNEVLYTITL